jgi:Uma2 family endonuclease
VVEVLSTATRAKDLGIKRKTYAGFGVQEYWIIDPEAETVDVLVLSKSGYSRAGIYANADLLASHLLPELNLSVAEIFF